MKYSRALNSLFDGPVSIEPAALNRLIGAVLPKLDNAALNADFVITAQMGAYDARPSPTYSKLGNVAVLDINGIIVSGDDEDNDYFGLIGCDRIASDLKAAMDDDDVSSIIAHINSPGGSVLGLDAVAAAFQVARTTKPIVAVTDGGMMCSAAYWLGSQCSEVVISRDSILGSIGVYATVTDTSRMYENAGVKVNLVKAGDMKGAGTPGTPVTDAQLAERQAVVNTYYGMFTAAVAAGRNISMEECLALADGRAHIGQAAANMKLANSIGSFDSVLTRLGKASAFHPKGGPKAMTKEEEEKAKGDAISAERKRAADINAAFPKDPAFASRMIAEGKSVLESKAEYSDVLQAKATADEAARAEEDKKTRKGFGNKALGNNPRGAAGNGGDDPAQAFKDAIDAYQKDHPGVSRAEAAQQVAKAKPELQHAALEGANRSESVESYRQYVAEDLEVGDRY